jgi:hypothetical protein
MWSVNASVACVVPNNHRLRALVAVSLYWFHSLNIGKISPKLTKTAPQ